MKGKLVKRNLKLKPEPIPAGVCRVMEGAKPCQLPSSFRGLCKEHYGWLAYRKQLGDLAVPSLNDTAARVKALQIKDPPQEGFCRLIDRGQACDRKAATRGLCHTHHHWLMVHDLLEDWGLPATGRRKKDYAVNPNAEPDKCRLLEDGTACRDSIYSRGLCRRHYSRVQAKGAIELFGSPYEVQKIASRQLKPVRQIELKRETERESGICRVMDNGLPCRNPVDQRGLCENHSSWARKHGQIEKLGLPPMKKTLKAIQLKPVRQSGICPVICDDEWCQAPAARRGLCIQHYQYIWSRKDLDLQDFVQDDAEKCRRGEAGPGGCHVWTRLAGEERVCTEKHWARGFCRTHYRRMKSNPDLLKLADPPPAKIALTIGYWRNDDQCRAIVNGHACSEKGAVHGLCVAHHSYMKYHERLAEVKKEPKPGKEPRFRKKDSGERLPGLCLLVRNDTPCRRTAQILGLCTFCYSQVQRRGRVAEFAEKQIQEKQSIEDWSVQPHPIPGLCRLEKEGEPCRTKSCSRGLCAAHSKLVARRKSLAALALPEDTNEGPYRVYLDKNIVLRYAEHCLGKSDCDRASVQLVEAVLAQKLVAYVSADTVRLTAYKTAKRLLEQGRSETEARAESRRFAGELFYGPRGYWVIIPDSNSSLRSCTIGGKLPELDLEDALDIWEYTLARKAYSIQGFVTHDREPLAKHVEALSAAQLLDKLGVTTPLQ